MPDPTPYRPPAPTRVKVSTGGKHVLGMLTPRGDYSVSMQSTGFPCSLDRVEFLDSMVVKVEDPAFAREGTSGSLVVTADNPSRPIGLVTGTSSNFVVFSPLATILKSLGLPEKIMA